MSLTKEENSEYKSDMAVLVKKKVKEAEQFLSDWRTEAKMCFDMVAGKQWKDEDIQKMESQERAPVVFNRIAAFVRGICGMEASNRQMVKYLPREMGDVRPNEVMNAAAEWVRDECNASDEESEAFRDMVIAGLGCTETRLDYDNDPEGMIFIERRDPLRVGYDPTAVKRNLQDAGWVYSFADYSRATFEAKWPEKAEDVFATMWPDGSDGKVQSDYREGFYENNDGNSQPNNAIRVIQFQYYKTVPSYRIEDVNGQTQEVPADRFKKMKPMLDKTGVKYVKMTKRQYRQCFIAGDIELDDVPLPADEFTLKFLTGIRDRNKGTFYGMVRDGIDPQRWSNKLFSLAIDILATNPKGGLLAETDAFEDRQDAEDAWANPREIVWARPGAIRDGKVTQRHPSPAPSGMDAMMNFAVSSMPQVMGVNMEFLGMADRAQAGILESQRKQAAITTLAEFFSALSLYRRVQGKCLMTMINRYLSDGRLIRIVGQQDAQYVPLIKQPGFEKFDVIVDEAPNSPDVKSRTWDVLQNMLPQMMKMGTPIPPEVLDYTPIPASLSAKWKEMLAKGNQMSPEQQKQMQEMQQQLQQLQQENQQLKSNQQLKMMELQSKREEMMAKLQMQKEESAAQLQLKREMAMLDAQIANEKTQNDMALKREQAIADLQMKVEEMQAQHEMKINELSANQQMKQFEQMTSNPELFERLQQESKAEEMIARTDMLAEQIQQIASVVSFLAQEESKPEEKDPEPKDINLVYNKDGTLSKAVLTKDDGSKVTVKVGRTK